MNPWLDRIIGSKLYKLNRHNNYIRLYNGSEIWIGGLGDKEQVDRILGHKIFMYLY
jgi:phage terminase large subunit